MIDEDLLKENMQVYTDKVHMLNEVSEPSYQLKIAIAQAEGQLAVTNDLYHYALTGEESDNTIHFQALAESLANYGAVTGKNFYFNDAFSNLDDMTIEIVEDIAYQQSWIDTYKTYTYLDNSK